METTQLTAELHQWLAELAELKAKTNKLKAKVFAHTFAWVEQVREKNKGLSDISSALKAFADTFKVPTTTASNYYYSGRYMDKNKLDKNKVDHLSVRLARRAEPHMTRAGRLKVLDAVRKGENHRKVTSIVRQVVNQKLKVAEKKADKLKTDKLTLNHVRIEALVFLTLAQKFFGDDVSVEVKIGGELKLKIGGR